MPGTALLIIDPQNDFHPGGSLAVEGADEDAARLVEMISSNVEEISKIFITLDSHQRFDIGHPLFWVDADGNPPNPFTIIEVADVESGKWKPAVEKHSGWAATYVKGLEANGRFKACIWPEHCLIGGPGHNVKGSIQAAVQNWAGVNKSTVEYVTKGTNPLTEMYSAIKADVVVPDDPSTDINTSLVESLKGFDRVLICGQALSHCVNYTTRDLADLWPEGELARLVLLTDAASNVGGFEADGAKFVADMTAKGLTLCSTMEAFKVLGAREASRT